MGYDNKKKGTATHVGCEGRPFLFVTSQNLDNIYFLRSFDENAPCDRCYGAGDT